MRFFEFHRPSGKKVMLNIALCISIYEDPEGEGSWIDFARNQNVACERVLVSESYESIMKAIERTVGGY